MKIKTQARFLVTGIVLTPLLIILINIVYQVFFTSRDVIELPSYEDISALIDESISVQDWEAVTRIAGRSSRNMEITIFRDDYLTLYSTIPDFTAGRYAQEESLLSYINKDNSRYEYAFHTRKHDNKRIYVLNRLMPREARQRIMPFFIPAVIIIILIVLFVVFAVVMSIIITKTITHSVQVLDDATKRIAEGELDLQVDVRGSNEITSLTNSLNKMRKALKEEELRRSRFIMGITHDLKTPLALIKGYAEAIEDDITEDPVSRLGAARIITTKADQLEGMINDLIDFVRMETDEWRKQLNKIDLTAFLKNFANTLSRDVQLFRHELIHDINLPENIFIPMDEKLVYRALENLVNNAIRYTPRGSVINFSAAMADNAVKLAVSDNGPGIENEDLPHVFEMFYRGSSSRREQGMGLGLAIVKWVTDYHGWHITVQSEKDKETSFIITIKV